MNGDGMFWHRPGALGDVLALRGALAAFALARPGAARVLAASGPAPGLLRAAGDVDRVLDLDRAAGLWFHRDGDDEPPPPLLAAAAGCGRGVAYLPPGEAAGLVARNLSRLLRRATPGCDGRVAVWPSRPPDGSGRWIYEYLAQPLAEFPGAPPIFAPPRPWPRGRFDNLAGTGFSRAPALWVLHPGSGSPRKNWPADRFAELGRRLAAAGARVAFAGGAADGDLARRAADGAPGADVWEGLSLAELAARLAAAEGYIGNDSGVTHLAAAAGAKQVWAIFGPSDPGVWRAPGARILRAPEGDPARLDIEGVWRAINS